VRNCLNNNAGTNMQARNHVAALIAPRDLVEVRVLMTAGNIDAGSRHLLRGPEPRRDRQPLPNLISG
jgi:hypothetical protein